MPPTMSEQERPRVKVWQPWFDQNEQEEAHRAAARRMLVGSGGVQQVQDPPNKDLPTRQRKVERSNSRRNDPLTAPKLRIKRQDSFTPSDVGSDDTEGPLDMTTGRRGSPPPSSGRVPPPPPPSGPHGYLAGCLPGYRPRPSVITYGPGRSDSEDGHCSDGDVRTPGREVIRDFPGVCDSVIDEHFRRSLGKHYASLFQGGSPSPPQTKEDTDIGMSVDDHFAKALGDAWTKLKKKEQSGEEMSLVT